MIETALYIVYALAAAYFIIGIVSFWRYDKVTRKADKMLEDIKKEKRTEAAIEAIARKTHGCANDG